jgi:hypothetical protein
VGFVVVGDVQGGAGFEELFPAVVVGLFVDAGEGECLGLLLRGHVGGDGALDVEGDASRRT